jgi:hypothetical protein
MISCPARARPNTTKFNRETERVRLRPLFQEVHFAVCFDRRATKFHVDTMTNICESYHIGLRPLAKRWRSGASLTKTNTHTHTHTHFLLLATRLTRRLSAVRKVQEPTNHGPASAGPGRLHYYWAGHYSKCPPRLRPPPGELRPPRRPTPGLPDHSQEHCSQCCPRVLPQPPSQPARASSSVPSAAGANSPAGG